jgi:hypothetical protein
VAGEKKLREPPLAKASDKFSEFIS